MIIEQRAYPGGQLVAGHKYRGGEYLPFYIPRERMPQVDEAAYPDLIKFLAGLGVDVNFGVADPWSLRAHQRVSMERVRAMPAELLKKAVLISDDRFVLDGNHRWAAAVQRGVTLNTIEIERPFSTALDLLFLFPATYSLSTPQPERN